MKNKPIPVLLSCTLSLSFFLGWLTGWMAYYSHNHTHTPPVHKRAFSDISANGQSGRAFYPSFAFLLCYSNRQTWRQDRPPFACAAAVVGRKEKQKIAYIRCISWCMVHIHTQICLWRGVWLWLWVWLEALCPFLACIYVCGARKTCIQGSSMGIREGVVVCCLYVCWTGLGCTKSDWTAQGTH